jgi:hypothetical protein
MLFQLVIDRIVAFANFQRGPANRVVVNVLATLRFVGFVLGHNRESNLIAVKQASVYKYGFL